MVVPAASLLDRSGPSPRSGRSDALADLLVVLLLERGARFYGPLPPDDMTDVEWIAQRLREHQSDWQAAPVPCLPGLAPPDTGATSPDHAAS